MKKNKKRIILSITAITLILLILVGLTYAYFLTNIQGNTNNKSISVDTANLALAYGDGNGSIVGTTVAPGTVIGTKTFTVTNTGNVTVSYGVFLEDVINDLERTSDLQLTITCSSSIQSKTCSGYNGDMPYQNDILLSNTLGIGETQTYSLTLEYIEPNVDQSVDMGKSISGKIQIYDLNNTVDLSGIITDYNPGDYIVVESIPKKSQIRSDGTFKVVGLELGNHTVKVYNSNKTQRYNKSLTINKGETDNISGTTVTLSEDSRTVMTSVSSSGLSITKTANSISLTSSNGASINKGTTTLTATISPLDATDTTITWTTSNPSVATLSSETTNITNGTSTVTVTGVNSGTATITATSSYGATKTYNITVTNNATSVAIASSNGNSIKTSKTTTLTATITPTNSDDTTVTWSATGSNIVSFSSETTNITNGTSTVTVTGVNAGTTTITARTSSGKTKTYSLTVSTVTLINFTINGTQYQAEEGMTWDDWISSNYNTIGIIRHVDYISYEGKCNESYGTCSYSGPINSCYMYINGPCGVPVPE